MLGVIPRLKLLNFVQIFVSTAVSAVIVTIKRPNCIDLLVARDLMDQHAENGKVNIVLHVKALAICPKCN